MSENDFDEFHDELRTVARDLLGKAERDAAVDWSLVTRSGWLGLEAPAEFDGAEATFAEVAILLGEFGRAAAHGPYASVAALGLAALGALAPDPHRDTLFRDAVAGRVIPVLTLPGSANPETGFRLVGRDGGFHLRGSADFVPDAPAADRLLIPATAPDGEIVLVAPGTGPTVTEQPVLDATRRIGRVEADRLLVSPEEVWHFPDGARALRRLRERAAVAVACDSLGLSAAMLDATVEYVGVRAQFGRAVGSFQAVKHACADMLVRVRVAGQLVDAAVRAQLTGAPDSGVAASMAKAYATAAAVEVAGKAMQLHGGIGYTWESGIHTYLKRATLNRVLYGSPAEHRRQLAARYRD